MLTIDEKIKVFEKERPAFGIILNYLKDQVDLKDRQIADIHKKLHEEIAECEEKIEKLLNFERRHFDELTSIMPNEEPYHKGFFLSSPINILSNRKWGNYEKINDPMNLYYSGECQRELLTLTGYTKAISMQKISEDLKLSLKIVKEVISELIFRKLIERKSVCGGCCYKLTL